MSRLVIQLVAAVATSLCVSFLQAQTLQSSVDILNFNVQLTDLNKLDLVSPSLKVDDSLQLTWTNLRETADLSGVYGTGMSPPSSGNSAESSLLQADVLSDRMTLSSGTITTSKTANTLSAGLSVDASTFASVPFGYYREVPEGADITAFASSSTDWILTQQTEAILSGTALIRLDANAASLLGNSAVSGTQGLKARVSGYFHMNIAARQNGDIADWVFEGEGPINYWDYLDASEVIGSDGQVTQIDGDSFLERNFSIKIRNTSNQTVNLSFLAEINASGSVKPITAVPEPGTCALMALGLACIVVQRRRNNP